MIEQPVHPVRFPVNRIPLSTLVAAGVAIVFAAGCASRTSGDVPRGAQGATARDTVEIGPLHPMRYFPHPDPEPAEPPLELRLRERATTPDGRPAPDRPRGTPLSAAEAAILFARAPAIGAVEVESFRFPPTSPPPPRTGQTITAPFPPPEELERPDRPAVGPVEPLRVLRVVPEGEVELAPHLTITFSQPMVPLTSVGRTEEVEAPVRLTPETEGRWRWIDTRTLRFQPQVRLPMATTFTVEVPVGARSELGGVLREPVRYELSTPAPRATGGFPHGGHAGRDAGARGAGETFGLRPVIVLGFDQRIDPAAVLRATQLLAAGRPHAVRPATPAEIAADPRAQQLSEGLEPERWVAMRPVRDLPRDAEIRIEIAPGALSTEGVRPTESLQRLRFRTYAPLEVRRQSCHQMEPREPCVPQSPLSIEFTNPLDTAVVRPASVRVEPAIAGMQVRVFGSQLMIFGDTRPRTSYRVTLDPRIRDQWGQALGNTQSLVFDVGDPLPLLRLAGTSVIVLDPSGPPAVRVSTRSHEELRARVYRVEPADWDQFAEALRRHRQSRDRVAFVSPGELVAETTIRPQDGGRGYSEIPIDVNPALTGGLGHAVVIVESLRSLRGPRSRVPSDQGPAIAWVQATRIGLSAMVSGTEVAVWASSLEDGRPLGGAELILLPSGAQATTAPDGTRGVPLSDLPNSVLVARLGDDSAILPDREPGWSPEWQGSWRLRHPVDRFAWYVATDRGLYRPGERAHVKGWIRRIEGGLRGDVAPVNGVTGIAFVARGPRGEELHQGNAGLTPASGFDFAVDLPEALNLGHATLHLTAEGARLPDNREAMHHLQVQEFRRPEYEVRLEVDAGPHLIGSTVEARATAAYYGGGGLPDSEVEWRIRSETGHFAPPGWDRWRFGRLPTWWYPHGRGGSSPVESFRGRTGADGSHRLDVELVRATPPFATTVSAEVEIGDVNRQVGSAGTNILVHPARVYAGLRTERVWVRPGDTVHVQIVGVDVGGAAVPGRPVRVWTEPLPDGTIARRGVGLAERDTAEVPREAHCRLQTAADPVVCAVPITERRSVRVIAEILDASDRASRTELAVWVAGGVGGPIMPRLPTPVSLELRADREHYLPGDTAEILVEAPFAPAEGVLTLRRSGLVWTERFRADSASHVLRVPIDEAMHPGVQVHVEMVEAARGVRAAQGQVTLDVPPRRRELAVTVTPADSVLVPGASTSVEVQVVDASGRPVRNAEVALWMVDESVLALGRYALPDPLEVFYPNRETGVADHALRGRVVLAHVSAGPGTLRGILLDAGMGNPLPGARVHIPTLELSARAANDGEFTLSPVPAGRHRLVITWEGLTDEGHEMEVEVPAEGAHLGAILISPQAEGLVAVGYGGDRRGVPGVAPAPPMMQAPELQAANMIVAEVTFDKAEAADGGQAVEVRTEFAPLAAFEPALRTGADGRVRVPVRLPQSLTRYRVMAVAVAGAQLYGRGESTVTARRELLVRPSAPRFLNFGDRAEIPVVVQNTTAGPLTVDVGLRVAGLDLDGPAAQRVNVPAGDRVELRFTADASQVGRARVQVVAVSGALSDGAEIALPIYTPATTEAFAVYGELDTGAPVAIPLAMPHDVVQGFGGLDVTVSSTALQALTDAILYLHSYPFEGAEQLASRLLGVAALRDVLGAFAAEGLPSAAEIDAAATRDIGRLASLQWHDGGWPLWPGSDRSHPYVSIHAAHALARAHEKGYAVPRETIDRAGQFLHSLARGLGDRDYRPEHAEALHAYALYVRDRLGEPGVASEARQRVRAARPELLSPEAMAWLLHVLARDAAPGPEAAELLRRIRNRVTETAATATFATSYSDGEYLLLHSARRSDAVILEALIAAEPGSDLIAKTARGLLAHRVAGRWRSTQENAWVLLALERYFTRYEATTPRFASRVWLGERYAGGHEFRGRTTERHHLAIPLAELARQTGSGNGATPGSAPAGDRTELLLQRAGEGRMYYRAGLRYAPADLTPQPTERGFAVERMYEGIDDPADVRREEDGSWRIRAGARVRVRVSMLAPERRHHVALMDPLPAGLEPVNPELAGTGFGDEPQPAPPPRPVPGIRGMPAATVPGELSIWRPHWWIHQNLRDDRAEAFAALLPAGSYEYTYVARATTPGTYVVPPPRAEELYAPETFGRGAGVRVIVE